MNVNRLTTDQVRFALVVTAAMVLVGLLVRWFYDGWLNWAGWIVWSLGVFGTGVGIGVLLWRKHRGTL